MGEGLEGGRRAGQYSHRLKTGPETINRGSGWHSLPFFPVIRLSSENCTRINRSATGKYIALELLGSSDVPSSKVDIERD